MIRFTRCLLVPGIASIGFLCPTVLADSTLSPAVYSAEQLIGPKQLVTDKLHSLLSARDYRNTATVQNPGEFSSSADSTLVLTRAFDSPNDEKLEQVPPLRLEVSSKTGEIRNRLGPPLSQFSLEPVLIQSQMELKYFQALARSEAPALGVDVERIFSGLDVELQRCAQSSLGIIKSASPPAGKTAFVAIDPLSGLISAWWQNSSNEDLVSKTQYPRAGLLKPFILYAALASLTPPSPLTPIPQQDPSATEVLRLRDVVGELDHYYYNDLATQLESDSLRSVLKRVGAVREDGSPVSSLAPLQAAKLLALFATLGKEVFPHAVSTIVSGNRVKRWNLSKHPTEKLDPSSTYLVNHLLGVQDANSGELAAFDISTTSGDGHIAWFAAVSPNRVSVLVGELSKAELDRRWKSYQSCSSTLDSASAWSKPARIEEVQVDLNTGLRADTRCRSGDIVTELFLPGTAPTEYCLSQGATVSSDTPSRSRTSRKKGFWRSLKDNATGIFK